MATTTAHFAVTAALCVINSNGRWRTRLQIELLFVARKLNLSADEPQHVERAEARRVSEKPSDRRKWARLETTWASEECLFTGEAKGIKKSNFEPITRRPHWRINRQ